MKTILATGAALMALGIAVPAMAACPDDISKLRTNLQKDKEFFERYEAGRIDRAAYTRLFDAAQTFADAGLDSRCQAVLAGIKELSEKKEAEAPRTRPPAAAPGTPRTDQRADRNAERRTTRAERLSAAKPLGSMPLSWDLIVGADVRNTTDNDLGEVEDVMSEGGKISSLVIVRGGFLGMGESHYVIPIDKAKIALLDDSGSAKSHIVVIAMTDEQMKAMPRVKKDDGRWVAMEDDRRTTPPATAPGAPPARGTAPAEKAPADKTPATPPRQ